MAKEEVLIRYSIGQVAEETGLSIHTLRYYEKEGILPPIKRDEFGARVFDEEAMEWLRFACCLRDTGMTIEEMKGFSQLTLQGDKTIPERVKLLNRQKERVANQVKQLMKNMSMIEQKLEIYREKL
ncbi:MAG: MarR family transcriptional regulator [Shouchella clausii]